VLIGRMFDELGFDRVISAYGITETTGHTDRFGAGRLRQLLSEYAGASPEQLLAALDDTLQEFQDGAPTDDVAALALRPRPTS